MPGAGVRFTVDTDDRAASRALQRAARQLSGPGLRAVLDDIGRRLETSTAHRFETGTGPDGVPWRPSRRAERTGGRTLVKSGRLKDSISRVVLDREVLVGTNVKYAAIHQFGGAIRQQARTQVLAFAASGGRFTSRARASRRRAGAVRVAFAQIGAREIEMPARPYLGISEGDARAIVRILARATGLGA